MNEEPSWKTALNWGVVVLFFITPISVLFIQIYANTHPGWWTWNDQMTPEQHQQRYTYLSDFMRNLTILVFGLAGLRTWENIKANGRNNGNGKTKEKKA